MKKILVFIVTFTLLLTTTFGQKLKDKNVAFYYTALPSQKLPDDFKTYSVRVYGSAIRNAGLNSSSLAKSIKMDGFKRLDGMGKNFGHLRISVYTGYVRTGQAEFKSKTKVNKDKKTGKETKTYTYWYEVPFESNGSYKIVDPDGTYLAQADVPYNKVMKTRAYSKRADLTKNYRKLIQGLRKSASKDAVTAVLNSARFAAVNQFDFNHAVDTRNLYFLKKYKTADQFDQYWEETKAAFGKLKKDRSADAITTLKKELEPALAFWKSEGDFNPQGDKKQKKVYKAANYNLALASYFLGDLETAQQHAQMVLDSEGKSRRAKRLLKDVEDLKKKMNLHGVASMHYIRDLSDAAAPAKVKEFEEIKEEMEASNETETGVMVMDGKEIKGSIMQTKGATQMSFGGKGNTKFVVEEDGKIKEYDLAHEDVTSFSIGERKFIKTRFSPSAKGESDANMSIMEEVYTSEKIKLYQYFPSSGTLSGEKTELAFQKAADDSPLSLHSTQFLIWKKGIAKYFSDCADLNEMCAAGEIKMERDDLIKAARIYSELCE